MRIALTHIYCWPDVRRGGERYLHEVASGLARRGHDVTILSTSSHAGSSTEEGVHVVRLETPRGEGFRRESRFGAAMFPRIVAGRYDIVHSLGSADAAMSIVAGTVHGRRRTVFTHLGVPDRAYYEPRPEWRSLQFVARFIDAFGTLSAHAAQRFEAGFGRRSVRTPGGVRLASFTPARVREVRPTLLFASAVDEPRKGAAVLLRAVALLADREPNVQLWLVGPGDPTALLDEAPEAARARTRVLPVTTEVKDAYARAWVTVLPSVDEAFGLVMIESLACGTPVVGADHSALPEVVLPGTGVLCEPGDAQSLADACLEALDLVREHDIVDRCRSVAAPYDWDTAIVPELERLYDHGPFGYARLPT